MPDAIPLLILGLGNPLCSDDGLGVAAISRLRRQFEPPEGVVLLEGGTLGLALLPFFQQAQAAILVDAIRADLPAGSFVRLEGDDVAPAVQGRLSVHQVGVADLLDGARLLDRYPDPVVLLGLVPDTYEVGVGCSPPVEDALQELVERVVEEARKLGFEFGAKIDQPVVAGGDTDLDRVLGL